MVKGQIRNIGIVLRAYRLHKEIDLRRLAKMTGVSAATLCRIESGGVPDADTWMKLMNWLLEQAQI